MFGALARTIGFDQTILVLVVPPGPVSIEKVSMKNTALVSALIAMLVGPAALWAQTPNAGSVGVAFNLPEGGGSGFGLRYLWSDGINMGVNVTFDLDYELASDDEVPMDESRTTWALGFTPDFRFYQGTYESIAPFFELGVGVQYAKIPEEDLRDLAVSGSVGIGAEWFPTRSVGISGSTGLRTTFLHSTTGEDDDEVVQDSVSATVFRSALSINFYF